MKFKVLRGTVMILLLVGMLTLTFNIQQAESPGPTRVYVDPLISYAGVSESFSTNVRVADVSNLYGFEFKLGYNTTFLDAIDVVIQPFLNEPTHIFRKEINDEYNTTFGFAWVSVTSQYPAEEVYGNGTLATITFQVMGLGGCALDLYDTKLSDPNGFPIDHSVEDGYYESGITRVVSTESTDGSYHPSLAVDSAGNVHIAWHDLTDLECGSDWDIFYKRLVAGSGWTQTEVVSTESNGTSAYPSLAVDLAGNIHIAWHDNTTDYASSGTDWDIFYKRYEAGVGWTSTEVVSTESNATSLRPSLAVGSDGTIHIAWYDYTDYAESGSDADIFYKRLVAGLNWTSTEVISTNSTGDSLRPSLAVDSSRNVHIAWTDETDYAGCGNDTDIFYKRLVAGSGWTETEVVSTNSTLGSFDPSLAVDSSRNVHIAWTDETDYADSGTDRDIFYRRYEVGVGWTPTEVVSTESNATSWVASLAVDSSRNVHIAWDDRDDDWSVFYKRYEVRVGWTYTQVVSTDSTAHSWVASLAVDFARNVHIAWHDETDYAGCGTDADIFYKYLRIHSTQYPWSMFRHNLRHTGYTESPAPRTGQTLWNYTTGGYVRSSPAVADGMVFVGSDDEKVYALDQHTGAHIWNYTTGGVVTGEPRSSPAVADGKVYVGSSDCKVYCLDAFTGAHIWNYTTGSYVESSPAVADGKVYVGSHDDNVYCLNASTGAHIWNYKTGHNVVSSPAVADGKVYVGSHDDNVYCLNASTGAYIWHYTTGDYVHSSPAVSGGMVYVGSDDYNVYCLDAETGVHIWNYTTSWYVWSSPAVADGRVFVGSFDGKVYCLDASTGAHIWNYTTGGGLAYSSPAVAGGMFYVGSMDHKVYCLNASSGAKIWHYTTGSYVDYSSPAVADGMVFVGSDDHVLYAFGNILRVPEDYPTVEEAIEAADPGATIIVAPGIYHEYLVVNKTLTIIGKKGSPGPNFDGDASGIAFNVTCTASGTIIANIVITNYEGGILIDNSSLCQIYNNAMSSMVYSGMALEGDNAANNFIHNNTFQENTIAINLTESSTSNTIYNNSISSNTIGLNLLESNGNTIYANTISQNDVGIDISSSSGNTIYHNNFIDNTQQATTSNPSVNTWDAGYPIGGNHWSNYNGIDANGDGIGDTPYEIDANNRDRYPLMEPWPCEITPRAPVGGIYIPVNKLELLAPYIGLTILLAAAVMTVGYAKKRKKNAKINS